MIHSIFLNTDKLILHKAAASVLSEAEQMTEDGTTHSGFNRVPVSLAFATI